ncbi:MAG: hypothetical protein WCF90_09045 [Methanomicrobiales archaeon]
MPGLGTIWTSTSASGIAPLTCRVESRLAITQPLRSAIASTESRTVASVAVVMTGWRP